MSKEIIPIERIAQSIRWIRGQKVMLDSDLAALYGVPTENLNKAVKRNRRTFPGRLHVSTYAEEVRRFEIPIWNLKASRRSCATVPTPSPNKASRCSRAFCKSDRAIRVNIAIMRAFVKLRQTLETQSRVSTKIFGTRTACREAR